MAKIFPQAYFRNNIIPVAEANLSIASAAVLYGLSVYTVFPVTVTKTGAFAFRLKDHYQRLINSAKIIGIDTFEPNWTYEKFLTTVQELVKANQLTENAFVRATVHVDELVPGTRSRGLNTNLSIFIYESTPIVPQNGMRLKTSVWRRIPDYAIPSRAKVNGAYVNSVLAKQDALDSGYDDCIFLDVNGHVCELSAANIFIVKQNTLITPDTASDLLEGINRQTVLEIAEDLGIPYKVRSIDLTELYTADEVFACGTSSFVATVKEIDARKIGNGEIGNITAKLRQRHEEILSGSNEKDDKYLVRLG
ncbi:MAG: aminotransferase class IV [Candidatus Pacebacteria bacterium]|nr:aminotransferase class IV [Candidatus Paceibacterota bacterium]